MRKEAIDNLIIIPKPCYISWEEITHLLHLGYSERKSEGLTYSAVNQSVKKTLERVGDGVCLVAILEGKLIGTESYKLVKKEDLRRKRWFYDDQYYYLHSLAVHPDYKRQGIGLKIRNVIRDEAIKNNIGSLISDTSEHAKWLISWYDRLGHRKVGYLSHPSTNYYSIMMRTPIAGREYNDMYRLCRYYLSVIFCKMLFKENGDYRFLGRLADSFFKMMNK